MKRGRKFGLRTLFLVALLGVLPIALAACGTSGGGSVNGDQLRFGSSYDVLTMDPAFADTEYAIDQAIYEGLVTYKPGTYEVVNQLAQKMTQSADGLRIDFKLKPNIPFHGNFGNVTAEDVKFSFERIAGLTKPKIASPFVADWAPQLKRVEVKNKLEGTIVLNRPFAPLMTTTLPALSGMVISKRAYEKFGKDFGSKPVGTGPYEVASFTPKRELVLKRFPGYGGASDAFLKPEFNEIIVTRNGDVNSVKTALATDELDVADFPPSEMDRLEGDDSIKTERFTSLWYDWLAMNVTDPVLSDKRVREAIRSAIDVPSIIAAAYNGQAEQATAVLPPTMPIGYWKAAPKREQDLAAAKATMDRLHPDGISLSLRLLAENPAHVSAAEIIVANLKEIGIDVKLKLQDTGTYYSVAGEALKKDQLNLTSFVSFPDPFWSMQWFTCDQVGVYNYMSWCDPEFDRLLTASTVEQDPEARSELYVELQELWDKDANSVWIAWPSNAYAMRSGLNGSFRPDGTIQLQAFSRK